MKVTKADVYLYGMIVYSTLHRLAGEYPDADGYGEIEDTQIVPGGETGNSAIVLAKWGHRVKVAGPFLGRKTREGVVTSKIGPMVNLSTAGQIYVGILAEHLSLLGRADPLVFRIGPNLWCQLSRHWNLYGYAAWPVHGPDHLGAWSGMYGAAGFLYRFATGESPSQVQ